MVCNPMSCSGFTNDIMGGCSMVWISIALLFFIIVFSKKWVAEPTGMEWSNLGAFLLGYGLLIVLAIFTCSHKWALGGGVAGAYIGGFLGSQIFGGGGSDYY